jgi:hypothetical protein
MDLDRPSLCDRFLIHDDAAECVSVYVLVLGVGACVGRNRYGSDIRSGETWRTYRGLEFQGIAPW